MNPSGPPSPNPAYQHNPPPAGRHGCLTAWLIFMIVVNGLTALASPLIQRTQPNYPATGLYISAVLAVFNIVCAVALLRYQKWGFWGVAGVSIIAFIVNLSLHVPLANAILGLAGAGILYGLLNMGDENTKAWPRLK